jgi:heme/copper-type cytochrome/quinol oxidase subunit 2
VNTLNGVSQTFFACETPTLAFKGPGGDLMKEIAIRALLPTAAVFALAFALCLPKASPVAAQDQNAQVIELVAKKYEYSPAPVHVKAGSMVRLKITAVDHDHGFKIEARADGDKSSGKDGLVFASSQDCWQLKKGETTTIEFLAQISGTYTFRCCHTCGLGHRGMKGQIVVD